MRKYDRFLTIGLFILEAFYFILIKQLPPKAARYPYFVLGLMVFLTLLLAINTFIIKPVYVILIDIIGFFVTTAIYLFVTMIVLKSNIKWNIVVSIVFPIFLYLVFVLFLKVPVPRGFLL